MSWEEPNNPNKPLPTNGLEAMAQVTPNIVHSVTHGLPQKVRQMGEGAPEITAGLSASGALVASESLFSTATRVIFGASALGLAVAVAEPIVSKKLDELDAKGRADYLKGGKIDTYEEVNALQNAIINDPQSPLPKVVKIDGKDMPIQFAINDHPDKIKEAMKDSPEALQTIEALQILEDYGRKFSANTITLGTEVPVQVVEKTPSPLPSVTR